MNIKRIMKGILESEIFPIFSVVFLTLVFSELLYLFFFSLAFNFSKILFVILYSLCLSFIVSLVKNPKIRYCFLVLIIFVIGILYFGEASYFNLFKSFALWNQILRVDEVAGIKGTLKDFININFIIFFIPFILSIVYCLFDNFNKNKEKTKTIIPMKQKILYLFVFVISLNGVSLFYTYVQQDRNKILIKNTTEYIRNYGLLDAAFINAAEPILSVVFKNSTATPELIEQAFSIKQLENEQTDSYEGKNFIFIEAESIAPYAIDEILTPTLYKMQQEGYSFENYYSSRTNTFASEYAILNSFYLTPEKEAESFSSKNSMPGLFDNLDYSTQSFHNFMPEYYKRNERMLELGFDAFYGSNELNILAEQPDFPSDIELFENSFQYIENKEQFFAYYITVSAHGGYNAEARPRIADNLEYVKSVYPDYDEKIQAYLAAAMITDQGVETLFANLEKSGQLDNTVIMFVGDHYPYAINGTVLKETFNIEETLDIYQVPCIIWDASKPSQTIENTMSNVDILPTVANLFGLDLKYGMGKDMFSPQKDGVIVEWYDNRSYSFMTAEGGYDDLTGKTIGNLSKNEVQELKKVTYRREEWNNSEYLRELLRDDDTSE